MADSLSERLHDLDLPLLSNIDDIRVKHYILELECDDEKKIFCGFINLVIDTGNFTGNDPNNESNSVNMDGGVETTQLKEDTEAVRLDEETMAITSQSVEIEISANMGEVEAASKAGTMETLHTTEEMERGITMKEDKTATPMSLLSKEIMKKAALNEEGLAIANENVEIETPGNTADRPTNKEEVVLVTEKEVYVQKVDFGEVDRTHTSELTISKNIKEDVGLSESSSVCIPLEEHDYHLKCEDNQHISVGQLSETKDTLKQWYSSISEDFVMILDACDLTIKSVHAITIKENVSNATESDSNKLRDLFINGDKQILEFCSEKTCLKIWKSGTKCVEQFPRFIRISYQTQPCGSSLKWTRDQDGRPCVYTHGHWINNRSLFPGQDVPRALATWKAYVTVPDDMVVLMSGDQNAEITPASTGYRTYIYYTDMEMPASTVALCIGYWTQVDIIKHHGSRSNSLSQLPCRLFAPRVHCDLSSNLMRSYIPRCMEAAYSLLGPHPFKRLDILIVPASFGSLGMASPNLMFLSQSILSDDGHMLVRVAHELSHSWFGLAIGPRDWHEEWLSEGFCTYTEYVIHAKANQEEELVEERDIYDHLKYHTLDAEIQSTEPDLQTLRKADDDGNDEDIKQDSVKYVANGMNPDKGFLQLHYLKGYFLLRFMENAVGSRHFQAFLKHLVESFRYMLIDSMDVLKLFFKTFPEARNTAMSEEIIHKDWLNCPGLPQVCADTNLKDNNLAKEVLELEAKLWECNKIMMKTHWRKRRKLDVDAYIQIPKLRNVQCLLFLDKLLERENIQHQILCHINEKLQLSSSNADVRHKWCELVIKHRLRNNYKDVGQFLVHHQAMGVYLFGELIISRDGTQRELAKDCFTEICEDMEEGGRKVVQTMVYGS